MARTVHMTGFRPHGTLGPLRTILSGLTRHLRILLIFSKVSLMQQMAYRPSFFFAIAGKLGRLGLILLFFHAVFRATPSVAGWTYDGVLLLFATFSLIDFLMSVTFHRNLAYNFPQLLWNGSFDLRLTKPIHPVFSVSFETLDLMDAASLLPALTLLAYAIWRVRETIDALHAVLYALTVGHALVLLFGLVLGLSAAAFWTIQANGIEGIFDDFLKMSRYPTDIYPSPLRVLLTYVIPVSCVATLPAKVLTGSLGPSAAAAAVLVSWGAFFLGLRAWNAGLRAYSSSGS